MKERVIEKKKGPFNTITGNLDEYRERKGSVLTRWRERERVEMSRSEDVRI